jgi:DNA-binding transcriptional ArsR family regulator
MATDQLSVTFAALADPTRRAILARLVEGEASVAELAAPFPISGQAISKHLRVLERAGLLARAKDGRVHRCRLVPQPMEDAAQWIERHRKFWEGRLDALQQFLENGEDEKEVEPWKRRRQRTVSGSRGRSVRRGSGSSGRGRNPS